MKRGVAVVSSGANRVGNARVVAVMITALATVLMMSVLALVAARTAEAAFRGGNGEIAFNSNRDVGAGEIYTTGPTDGTTATRITTSTTSSDPAYSPDGRRIAYVSTKPGGDYQIFVMNSDGTGRRQVTTSPTAKQQPAWSPDGTKLAYVANSFDVDGQTDLEIWTINADGSRRRQLTNNSSVNDTQPAWSPDGSRIAFASQADVYVMNAADGSGQTNLTPSSPAGCSPTCYQGGDAYPAWSPDGTRIAYVHGYGPPTNPNAGGGVDNIWVMDPDGTDKDNLSETATVSGTMPAWSPDGTRIAYVGATDTNRDIWVMNVDGSDQAPLHTDPAHDINPDWQPITLAVNDVKMKEKRANAVLTVGLPTASEETITVNYATTDGRAKTPADYTATSGTLTFAPGQTTQQIAVPIRGDRRNEPNEKFFVDLSDATNAPISDAQGRVTIVDND